MTPVGGVVVGVGEPEASRPALEWAMAEAARRRDALTVVHAFHPGHEVSPVGIPGPALDLTAYEAAAKALIDEAIDAIPATRRAGITEIRHVTSPLSPAAALLEAGTGADVLVVGRRERRAVPRLLGSVSHQCVHHARCPVTVVPVDWQTKPIGRIVVGVDGSCSSRAALQWALDEAARWGADLVVAHAWNTPYPVEPWGLVVTPRDGDLFRRSSNELIDAMVEQALRAGRGGSVGWRAESIEDASGPALVHAAADADLLVVGSRGRGGFAALLLGSTSLQCVHHAACPVTVVRDSTQPGKVVAR